MHANFAPQLPAFLPPGIDVHRAAGYVIVASLTAYMYDWLLAVPDEHAILAKSGFSWSNTIYFMSRIASLCLLISAAISTESDIDCEGLKYAMGTLSFVSTMSTCFLFLLRVRAVYNNSRTVTVLFGSLWLVGFGLYALDIILLHSERISYSHSCTESIGHNHFLIIRTILTCLYDTLVFLAISCRLTGNAMTGGSWRAKIRSFLRGAGLYSLSRSLLKSGQVYYLATIGFFVPNLATMLSPSLPISLRFILVPGYIPFINMMACRVFRDVALGIIQDPMLTSTTISAAFRSAPHVSG